MGRIFGFAWWDLAGVPDDNICFIRNVNPVFVMTDWARGMDKSPKSANPLRFIRPALFLMGRIQLFPHLARSIPRTYFHIARINN
jgi:hypothetical protein